jgi:hypothetical protein
MTDNCDPDECIKELERFQQKTKILKHKITDADLMIHIINNLGPNYSNIADQMAADLDKEKINLKDIKNRSRAKYNRFVLLKSKEAKKQYKGGCNKCGKWVHNGADRCTDTTNKPPTHPNNKFYNMFANDKKKFEHANNAYNKGTPKNLILTAPAITAKRRVSASQTVKNVSTMKIKREENINVARHISPRNKNEEYLLAAYEYCSAAEVTNHDIWIGDSHTWSRVLTE